jgi:predicted dehydrogenase
MHSELQEDSFNRRDFFKTFTAIAGTSLIASALPWLNIINAQPIQSLSPSDKVRLGIIGSGSRGSYLMDLLRLIPNAEMVAVCDNYPPNLKRGVELAARKAHAFTNYLDLLALKDIDAVIIATPLTEHFHITMDALSAGKHVFCEKSMSILPVECLKMVQAHYKSGKILQIGHQRLFDIKYNRTIDLIRQGAIGKITQIRAFWHRNNDWRRPVPSPDLERKINWRLYRDQSLGLMTELASHQIQVANWALNSYPVSVMGSGSTNYWNDGREVFDNVNLVFKYPGGIHFIYDSLISNKKYGYEEQIQGNLGTIEAEKGVIFKEMPPPAPGIVQLVNSIEHKLFEVVPLGGPSWVPDNPSEDKGKYLIDKILRSDGSDMELEAFIATVRQGNSIPGHIEQGYYATIASILGHQAMTENRIVEFPKDLIL